MVLSVKPSVYSFTSSQLYFKKALRIKWESIKQKESRSPPAFLLIHSKYRKQGNLVSSQSHALRDSYILDQYTWIAYHCWRLL